MTAKQNFERRSPVLTIAAAAAAAFAGLTILWATVTLFQSRGVPMEQAIAASRACAHHAYQSERDACMKQWLAESQVTRRSAAR